MSKVREPRGILPDSIRDCSAVGVDSWRQCYGPHPNAGPPGKTGLVLSLHGKGCQ